MRRAYKQTLLTVALLMIGCIGFALAFSGGGSNGVLYENMSSEDKPLRLHVLANSDDAFDQQIKLATRDFIIGTLEDILNNAENKQQAMDSIEAALPELEAACNQFLDGKVDYQAELRLEKAEFPAIDYDGMVFAAGEYDALRILLGEAEGKNWWCVLFPPLCFVDLAGEYQPDAVAAMAGSDAVADENGGYRVEWKLAQLFK